MRRVDWSSFSDLAVIGAWESLSGLFGRFHYLAPFTVLLLCGVGLPMPEEVALIGSGILLAQDKVEALPIILVCSGAILLGDSIPFWLGRHYGLAALRTRWVARILHPERFAVLERRFAEKGNWAIFTCRFLPGLRLPGYFVAGTLGMSYSRFMVLDALGVALSVPASILVAAWVGGTFEEISREVRGLHMWLLFALVSLLLVLFVRGRMRRRIAAKSPQGP
jgi:membrane protein DedA with SNARE-associated domain